MKTNKRRRNKCQSESIIFSFGEQIKRVDSLRDEKKKKWR